MAAVLRVLSLVLLASSPLTLGRVTGEVKGIQVFPFHKMLLADPALPDNYNNNLAGQHSPTQITFMQIPSFSPQPSSSSKPSKQELMQTFLFSLWLLADLLRLHTTSSLLPSPFALFQTFAFPLVVVALELFQISIFLHAACLSLLSLCE